MGLTPEETNTLATFNSEVARGIQHTEAWIRQMMKLQHIFDEERRGLQQIRRFDFQTTTQPQKQ